MRRSSIRTVLFTSKPYLIDDHEWRIRIVRNLANERRAELQWRVVGNRRWCKEVDWPKNGARGVVPDSTYYLWYFNIKKLKRHFPQAQERWEELDASRQFLFPF